MDFRTQYRYGFISKDQYLRELRKERQRQEKFNKYCTEITLCLLCCSAASICFDKEDEKSKKYFCGGSMSGVTYGALTTALSAGACDVRKSTTCLKIGITALVLGTLCGLGLCVCEHYCKEDAIPSPDDPNEIPAFTIPSPVITQQPSVSRP